MMEDGVMKVKRKKGVEKWVSEEHAFEGGYGR